MKTTTVTGWFSAVVAALSLGVGGCGAMATEGPDTSSHWLETCTKDDACASGQSCLCGVCTTECDRTSECREHSDDARCVEVQGCSTQAVCALESTFDASLNQTDADADTLTADSDDTTTVTDNDTAVPDGCEFLAEQAALPPSCGSTSEQCEQAKGDKVERSYTLMLDDYYQNEAGNDVAYSDEEVAQRQQCLLAMARNLGFGPELLGGDVWVSGLWTEVEPLVNAVTRYYVECADCEYCYAFDEGDCNTDAFCAPRMGRPANLEQECLEAESFFECLPAGTGCDDSVMFGSFDAKCWWLPSICPTKRGGPEQADACTAEDHETSDLYAFELCGDLTGCYSPFDNTDLASSDSAVGCACDYEFPAAVCLDFIAFWCWDGVWQAGADGICIDSKPDNCGATFDTLEQCFAAYAGCFSQEEGGFCGVEKRADRERVISELNCTSLGGLAIQGPKPSHSHWIEIDDEHYCENSGDVSSAFCETAGGALQCDSDGGLYCPDGHTTIYDVTDCQSGTGTCCFQ